VIKSSRISVYLSLYMFIYISVLTAFKAHEYFRLKSTMSYSRYRFYDVRPYLKSRHMFKVYINSFAV